MPTKEVTGSAKMMAGSYKMEPAGNVERGVGPTGVLKASNMFKKPSPPDNGVVDTQNYGLTKGPMSGSLGRVGVSMSGNGTGRFTGKNQNKTGGASPDFPNRVPGK